MKLTLAYQRVERTFSDILIQILRKESVKEKGKTHMLSVQLACREQIDRRLSPQSHGPIPALGGDSNVF